MGPRTTAVRQRTTLELLDPAGRLAPLNAVLSYDPLTDPYAVSASFDVGGGEVVWTFARDLLLDGLVEPSGDGDVHVWPARDEDGAPVVQLELNSPDGEALLQMRTSDVRRFLAQALDCVPRGQESAHLDLDGLVRQLLAS